ncbi:MAG: hypothetical protein IKU28_06565, partial [Erysipelotrichaceae bacterium]|nr:hypothetical protein [Erysipelotrichaceae bacterium]
MNTRKVDKREQHVRKKLTAAILMLLISCIMTVTSTYAWFTLSTAPEVTGIQTTIGGNGNLEIALANYFTWNGMEEPLTLSSSVNDIKATNESWGNLIDVSEDYGMNLLTLAPAKVDGSSSLVTTSTILQVPTYGADGRVSTLAPAMFAGYDVDSKTFKQIADAENDRSTYADNIGLRAIGISTARTARQTAFTAAKSAMTTAVNTAKLGVGDALANNGSALGSLAVKLALDGDTATFDNSELLAIYALVEDTIEGVEYIDDAIIALIDASVASREGQEADIDDLEYELISAMLENAVVYEVSYDGGTKTTNSSFTLSEEGVSPKTVTFTYSNGTGDVSHAIQNDYFYDMIKMYMNVVDDLENALDKLPDTGGNSYSWADISESVNILMDMESDGLKVAGISINTLKENPTNYIDAVLNNTVVELGEGSGVYYNIASLVGTVKASIVLEITYGFNVTRPATISSTNNMPVIPTASLLFELPSADGSEEANQISDIYGFVLDL